MKNGVKIIQTAGYNGARTVLNKHIFIIIEHFNKDPIFGFSLYPTELNSRLKLGPTNNCRKNDQIGMI